MSVSDVRDTRKSGVGVGVGISVGFLTPTISVSVGFADIQNLVSMSDVLDTDTGVSVTAESNLSSHNLTLFHQT